ncbi:MAG TPA: OPT/YSL family transporter [Candidatus Babeliales bacterium]|nr:OPT/YSL family transporter [Candidatus Babeliales bacterium]
MVSAIGIVLSVLFSIISTGIMSYIGMATPIGPWIASTLVLGVTLLLRLFITSSIQSLAPLIFLIVSSASIGGILATALAFSLPTLYFLKPELFCSWMAEPELFVVIVTGLSLSSGLYGFWIADAFEDRWLIRHRLEFPIAQLVYRMLHAQDQIQRAYEMVTGFFGTLALCVLQEGMLGYSGLVTRSVVLCNSYFFGSMNGMALLQIPLLRFDLFPSFWAIGFVTGHLIAVPLLIGVISKVFFIDPIKVVGFYQLSDSDYLLAFCSGMVMVTAIQSLIYLPKILFKACFNGCKVLWRNKKICAKGFVDRYSLKLLSFSFVLSFVFLQQFHFSVLMFVYLLFFTLICTFQVVMIAGRTGLALLGRFATFVMVPAMFLFNVGYVELVFIATFVEIASGVATDVMFGRKLAQLANIPHCSMRRYQLLGLVIGGLSAGIVFWLLINSFGLGSADLFAQRAQARALLINIHQFDMYALLVGMIYGGFLHYCNVNPMLVLGGLLMPLNVSLGLITGGVFSLMSKNKERWYPFWSGVFASNSLWMIVRSIY